MNKEELKEFNQYKYLIIIIGVLIIPINLIIVFFSNIIKMVFKINGN